MKWGFVTATVVSLLMVGCYTGEEVSAPPIPSQDTTPPVTANVAAGALVYDNWLSMTAGGTGVSLLDEPEDAYVQCVSCHGWDRRGSEGGYARRPRTETQPNAGHLVDGDTLGNRRIDNSTYTAQQITQQTTGRYWAEGSTIYNVADYRDGLSGAVFGNKHPDYMQAGGLTTPQLDELQAFLSDTSRTWSTVFARINPITNPVGYTVVSAATDSNAATAGQSFYTINCSSSSCHGTDARVLAPVLETDGGHSYFMFRTLWGSANVTGKTHESMGSPRPLDVANVMVYVNKFVTGNISNGAIFWASYGCASAYCHDGISRAIPSPDNVYANLFDLNNRHKSKFAAQLRDLTEQEVADLREYIRTL